MKIFKNLVSVLMVLCVLLLLFSCGKTENNGETTLPDTTVKETVSATEKEKRIPTVEEVAEANLLENLLKRNKCVYYKDESDYSETTEIYFTFNSQTVRACDQIIHEESTRFKTAEYKGMNMLAIDDGKMYVRAFFDEFGTEEAGNVDEPWYNDSIAYTLINDNLRFKEETDEFYVYENLDDDPKDEYYIQSVCYVDKETLNVMKTVHVNDDIVVEKNYVYNEPTEMMDVLDDWNGKMKTVTVVYDTYENGESVRYSREYEVPANWEVLPDNAKYETPPFFAYFDEGYTKEYTYPGDGIDYTIYVSTSVG